MLAVLPAPASPCHSLALLFSLPAALLLICSFGHPLACGLC
jgi:hypothetical protein